jgi:hypothetical protein
VLAAHQVQRPILAGLKHDQFGWDE